MSDELNRDEISRHDFLGIAGVGSAAAVVAFSTVGMLRLPKPRVLPDVSSVVRLGKPSEFPPGTVAMLPQRKVCVVSTEEGISVVSLVCTHLGCLVKLTEAGFDCPCHGSKFAITDGHVTQGPATSGLGKATVTQKGETLTISGS